MFAPELGGLDRDQVRDWYNGYSWRGEEKVYNPFDILLLFRKREFAAHWFETGTPTFLVDTLFSRRVSSLALDGMLSSAELLSTFDVDYMPTEALLFQTGYLTIDLHRREARRLPRRRRVHDPACRGLGGTPRDEWHQWGRTLAALDDWLPTGGGDAPAVRLPWRREFAAAAGGVSAGRVSATLRDGCSVFDPPTSLYTRGSDGGAPIGRSETGSRLPSKESGSR